MLARRRWAAGVDYRHAVTGVAQGVVTGSARTRDGLELRTYRWPSSVSTRAHLLLIHGIAEHAGRHAQVASRLGSSGIETHAFDLRGFGGSGGRHAYVDRWSRYHDDVEDQLAQIRSKSAGLPVILYGHSMGGLIALGYVLSDTPRPEPDLLVLSAPAIASAVPLWKRSLAGILGRLAPELEIPNALPPGALSHDPEIEDAYRSDPLNRHSTTTRLGLELFREQARVQERLARRGSVPVPTYVLHGSGDHIVPVTASAGLEETGNATRRVYEGLRHEMHNEPDAATISADTIAWIEAHI